MKKVIYKINLIKIIKYKKKDNSIILDGIAK